MNLILADPTPLGNIVHSLLNEKQIQEMGGYTAIIPISQSDELQDCFRENHIGFLITCPSLIMAARNYYVVRSLRRQTQYRQLPIIMIRNHPGKKVLRLALEAGVTDIITFPDQIGTIRRRLVNALTQHTLSLYC